MGANVNVLEGFYNLLYSQMGEGNPLEAIKKIYMRPNLPEDNPEFPSIVISDFSEDDIISDDAISKTIQCSFVLTLFSKTNSSDDNILYGDSDGIIYLSEKVADLLNGYINNGVQNVDITMKSAELESEVISKSISTGFIWNLVGNRS